MNLRPLWPRAPRNVRLVAGRATSSGLCLLLSCSLFACALEAPAEPAPE
jgi:hypothetical protein